MFGISCAPEKFQKIIEQILCGLKNVKNFQDDMIVWGKDVEEHDKALEAVLKRLREFNVLLNDKKCVFKVPETEFLGFHLSGNGIKPSKDKVRKKKLI